MPLADEIVRLRDSVLADLTRPRLHRYQDCLEIVGRAIAEGRTVSLPTKDLMPGNLNAAFWHDDFGFLIDRTHTPVGSSDGDRSLSDDRIAETLEASGRLPPLGNAPVACWLLPRLVAVTHDGIHLDDGEHVGNDGGCICLNWVAFNAGYRPRACFALYCYTNRIVMRGTCMSNTEPTELVSAFLAPLLAQPAELTKWCVTVTDTDPPTNPGKRGRAYIFGWDGRKFLGARDYE